MSDKGLMLLGKRKSAAPSDARDDTRYNHIVMGMFGKNEDATSDRVDTGTALYALVRDRLAEDDQEEDPLMHPDYAVDPQGSLPTQPMKRQRTESSQIPTAADSQGQQAGQSSDGQTSKSAKPPRARRKIQLNRKIISGERHPADQVTSSSADMTNPLATKTGWSGVDFHRRPEWQWLKDRWKDRSILRIMVTERGFTLVRYKGRPTVMLDRNGIVFGFRSDIPSWVTDEFLNQFADECRQYMKSCGRRSEEDIEANNRGNHWYMVVGIDRQNKPVPQETQFHQKHRAHTNALLKPGSAIARIVNLASDILRSRFPSLAQRVDRCKDKLCKQGHDHYTPQFNCFYNFCINGPQGDVLGVSTEPHVDGKNLALMFCAVFVWGKFNYKEKAWLVLWEAGLIIELPPGVLMFYPLSLFTHFNVDISDLKIVTTSDGCSPTPDTCSPLKGVDGRGSVVFFNQASMFQLAENGCSVKDAHALGKKATCDNTEFIANLPRFAQ